MKAIHEAVQKELELQQMLKQAIREKELGLRELQKMLLSALYIVNQLLDEKPEQATAAHEETVEPELCEQTLANSDAALTWSSQEPTSPPESGGRPLSESSPRDIP